MALQEKTPNTRNCVTQPGLFGVRVTGISAKTLKEKKQLLTEIFGNVGKVVKWTEKKGDKIEIHIFYANSEGMYRACATLHEYEILGKRINVTMLVSQPKELYDLYISGHPGDASNEELRKFFKNVGNIDSVRVTNKGKYCFLQVYGKAMCDQALKCLNGLVTSSGRQLSCELSKKKETLSSEQLVLAKILNEICEKSHIHPPLSEQDMFILERSIRTYHLSGLHKHTTKETISKCFQQYGSIEKSACIFKEGYKTAYGFVIFASHEGSQKFRDADVSTLMIDDNMVKISASKPTNSVIASAKLACLLDYESNPTMLLSTVLKAGLDELEKRKKTENEPKTTVVYLQNPLTGQYFLWTTTQEAYLNFISRQNYHQPAIQPLGFTQTFSPY